MKFILFLVVYKQFTSDLLTYSFTLHKLPKRLPKLGLEHGRKDPITRNLEDFQSRILHGT